MAVITFHGTSAEHVHKIDLLKQTTESKAKIRKIDDTTYEWHLDTGAKQEIAIDLPTQGVDLSKFDEIRFDIKPLGSQVGMIVTLENHPREKTLSNWYLKFKTPLNKWTTGRYQLSLDDDGIYYPVKKEWKKGRMRLRLYRRILGFPGEPQWRKALIRNFRLVRNLVSIDYRMEEVRIENSKAGLRTVYPLHLENRSKANQIALLKLDSTKSLKFFKAEGPKEIPLKPGEKKVVEVAIVMDQHQALRLPAMYSEMIIPEVSLKGVEHSDAIVLCGYRRQPLWGSVPVFSAKRHEPAFVMPLLEARKQVMPSIAKWEAWIQKKAKEAMKYDWPVPLHGPPLHDQLHKCRKCRGGLKRSAPNVLRKHTCTKCGAVFEKNDHVDRTYLMTYNRAMAKRCGYLALSWLTTNNEAHAKKCVEILANYADNFEKMPRMELRSTPGFATRLGANSLHSSYVIPYFATAYTYIKAYPMDEAKRKAIRGFLIQVGINAAHHSVEYNNQQAEHLRAYGSVGIATEFWPLAAEAIYGDFGWHEMVEYGFSDDGIAPEGGVYHVAALQAMNHFAGYAYDQGINLFTERFKRTFDGTLSAHVYPSSIAFEMPFVVYRDPRYISWAKKQRPSISTHSALTGNLATAFHGLAGLPDTSALKAKSEILKEAGYVFLRRGSIDNAMTLAINYIKTWDRHEHDRFGTAFYYRGGQIDSGVGRISYGFPTFSWCEQSAAHNLVVIDGGDQREFEGELVAYQGDGDIVGVALQTTQATPFYEGVHQMRGAFLWKNYYIVIDRNLSERPHVYDRYQYAKGTYKVKGKKGNPIPALDTIPPKGKFKDLTHYGNATSFDSSFGKRLRFRILSDKNMDLYRAVTIGGYTSNPMEVTFCRVKDQTATFVSLATHDQKGKLPQLKILSQDTHSIKVEIQDESQKAIIFIDTTKKAMQLSAN